MPFLKFSRDRRGYEHFYVVQQTTRRGTVRNRVLYWFRTPPGVKVGRAPFDDDVRRALEKQNPGVTFDWQNLLDTPIPPPAPDAERWRERRRIDRETKQTALVKSPETFESTDTPETTATSEISVTAAAAETADDASEEHPPLIAVDEVGPVDVSTRTVDAPGSHPSVQRGGAALARPEGPAAASGRRRRRRRGGRHGRSEATASAVGAEEHPRPPDPDSPGQPDADLAAEPDVE